MDKFKIFTLIYLLQIIGCNHNPECQSAYALVRQEQVLKLPLSHESRNLALSYQYIDSSDYGFPALIVQGHDQIELYNCEDKCRINSILLQKEGPNGISGIDGLGYKERLVYCFGIDDSLHISEDLIKFRKVPIQTNYKFRFAYNFWKYFVAL